MKSKKIINKIIHAVSLAIILFVIGFSIISQVNFNLENNLSGKCEKYKGEWIFVNEAGERTSLGSTVKVSLKAGEKGVVETVLPDTIEEGTLFSFLAGYNTEIYVDGELRDHYLDSDNPFHGGLVKNKIMQVKLLASDAGKVLSIVRQENEDTVFYVKQAYIGDKYGIFCVYTKLYGVKTYGAIVLAAISLVCLIIAIYISIRDKKETELLYMSGGIFALAWWLITDSNIYQYVFGVYFADGLISYMVIMIAPISFLFLMEILQKNRYRTLYNILEIVIVVDFLVMCSLHFTETLSFAHTLLIMNGILAVAIIGIFVSIIIDVKKGNVKNYMYIAIGILGFAIMGVAEIIVINTSDNESLDGLCVLTGLYFLMAMNILHAYTNNNRKLIEASDALKKSELKSNFLANMSHEIRTPITAIMGMDDMILIDSKEPKVREYALNIKSASNGLLSIINDILDFSKIEAGKLEFVNSDYDLASLINDMAIITKLKTDEKNLIFEINVDEELPSWLYGDEMRVRQIIINILTNAVKYTEKGKVIFNVHGEIKDNMLQLMVDISDTGIGIKEEDQDRLFERFERLDENQNRGIVGTGLGLAIVSNLVKLMEGKITVESTYGVGSVFHVIIPQKIVNNSPIGDYKERYKNAEVKTDNKVIFSAPKARILIVDDNRMNLAVAEGLLKKTGIKIDTCTSGPEMLELVKGRHYDVILLDHMMPQMDGLETLKNFRKMKNTMCDNTPVIAMTANAIKGVKEDYINAGFTDYISKPFSFEGIEKLLMKYIPEEYIGAPILEEPEEETEVPEIAEFDMKYAMGFMGDKKLLLSSIKDFRKFLDNLENKFTDPKLTAHTLKSTAASVGALTLSRLARLYEMSIINNDEEKGRMIFPLLADEIRLTRQRIDEVMHEEVRELKKYDEEAVKIILGKMFADLEKYDYDNTDGFIEELGAYEYPADLKNKIEEICERVNDFEREIAMEEIGKLI